MSIINDHKVHSAVFTNDAKDNVRMELVDTEANAATDDDELVLFEYTCEAKEGDPDFEALLKQVTIDDLHENTVNMIRDERDRFEATVLQIAHEQNLIQTIEPITSNIWESLVEILFEEFDVDKQKEQLFMLKLKLFELEPIKSSKDRAMKAKLRKAADFVDALKYALLIVRPDD